MLRERGETVATAESLTGGLVCATLVDAPGASAIVRGAVVAYAADVKSQILGVDDQQIASYGTVDAEVARQMAEGIRLRLGATWGVATTGNAGPEPSEGKPVGIVFIAVAGPGASAVRELSLSGDRDVPSADRRRLQRCRCCSLRWRNNQWRRSVEPAYTAEEV